MESLELSVCSCYDGRTVSSVSSLVGCNDSPNKYGKWSLFTKSHCGSLVPMKSIQIGVKEYTPNEQFRRAKSWLWNITVHEFVNWKFFTFILVSMDYLLLWCLRTGDVLKEQIGLTNVDRKSKRTVYCLNAVGQQQNSVGSSGDGAKDEHDMRSKRPSYVSAYRSFGLEKIQKNDPKVGTVIKWELMGDERPSREAASSESPNTRHQWLL